MISLCGLSVKLNTKATTYLRCYISIKEISAQDKLITSWGEPFTSNYIYKGYVKEISDNYKSTTCVYKIIKNQSWPLKLFTFILGHYVGHL